MKRSLILLMVFCAGSFSALAKTEKFGTWIELTFTKKFLKDFEFSIIPEFRLQDDFSMDEYILEGKLGYEPFKFLDFATSYRYNTNVRDKGNEISHNVVFDVTGKTKIERFDASLRTRFTNDSDGGELQWEAFFFRPRAKIKYNIKGSKIDPYVSYELFYDFKYSNFFKGRFDAGVSRNLSKQHKIGLYYRNQDYFSERNSVHIIGIDYGFKF